MKILKFCSKFILKIKYKFILYLMLSSIISISGIILPLINGSIIDDLITNKNYNNLIKFSLLFLLLNLIVIIINFFINRLYIVIQSISTYEMNMYVLKHLRKIPLSFMKHKNSIYLNEKINSDCNQLTSFSIMIFSNILINLLTIIFTCYILISFNYKIIVIILSVIMFYLVIYSKLKNKIFEASFNVKETRSTFFSKLSNNIIFIKSIKMHILNKYFNEKTNEAFSNLLSKLLKFQKTSYFFISLDSIVINLAQTCIFFICGIELINGNLTIGFFTVITKYFSMVINSMRYFFNLGKDYQEQLVSYTRLLEYINILPEHNGQTILNEINSICFKDLSFSYENKNVFKLLNLDLYKGNIYCIRGKNGQGKTTLLNLILGLFPDEFYGKIVFNGIDSRKLDMYKLRENLIGISEQEPILLNDTILKNIILDGKYDKIEIENLLKIFNMTNFIDSQTNGIYTVINENSSNISGGEKQKISIIRSLLKKPEILILDEPTSAIDENSKKNLVQYLHNLKDHTIIIMASHDKELLNISDFIIDIDDKIMVKS